MKEKLYYLNPYTKSFSAHVVKQEQGEDGGWYVVLDQTAFYPTGGGQPYDEGTIDGRKVINVEEVEGEIRHYLDGPLQEIQEIKTGEIDWARRFDHMQQHCGQHILSAAFDHLFQYKTVGFHLGAETLTIDLETENLTKEEINKAEELANKIILENRLIEVKWVTEEELSQYSLRKETKVKEDIRLVIIPDFDYNGCGGTHPNTTGEVSAVKILDWERQKKKVRVQFVCGNRVIQQLDRKQQILLKLTKLLNSPEKEMEAAVLRLLDSGKSLEKALEQAKENLLLFEAKELTSRSAFLEGNKMAAEVFHNRSIQELQKLARFVTTAEKQVLVFFVSETENRLQLVFARGVARTENMKTLIGEILPLIHGKGGGNESFAQGGGELLMPAEEILHKILTMVN
jgi:alanyl-tRNA synthetase